MFKPVFTTIICLIIMFAQSGICNARNLASGKVKSKACGKCHGIEGKSKNPAIPDLAGQQVAYSITQLKAYRDGIRKDSLMNEVSQSLTDDEIRLLAEYTFYLK